MDLLYVLILVGIVGIALGIYFLTQNTRESVSMDDIPDAIERLLKAQKEFEKRSEEHSDNS